MHPRVCVSVALDRLSASLELLPGEPLAPEELAAALSEAGVVHGVLQQRIELACRYLAEHGSLPRPVRVAEGTPPQPGAPAQLELLVASASSVGRIDERDGTIDFAERGAVSNVAAGQAIGRMSPARAPRDGCGVDGSVLTAPPLQPRALDLGENVDARAGDDGCTVLVAAIDGVLRLGADGTPSVVDLLEIDGDVDLGTGNIDASGSVRIAGNVRSGLRVRARCDVHVGESIEEAVVEAGGDVLVRKGVLGGAGWISAGGSVQAGFLQNARVRCAGDVVLGDSATSSTVLCGGDLTARSARGRLRGGRYAAAGAVRARELGSELGVATEIEAGGSPALAAVLAELAEHLDALRRSLAPALDAPAPPAALPAARPDPEVTVERRVWHGVDIALPGAHWRCEDLEGRRRFRPDDGQA